MKIRLQDWSDSIGFEGSSVLWEGVTISWSGFGWWNNLILYSGRLRQGYDLYFSVLAFRFTIQVQLTLPTLELIVNWEFRTTEWEIPLPAALLCNKVSGRRRNLSSPSDYIYGYMMMRSAASIAKTKANFIVPYKAVTLSRSIRPNKYPKIEFEIESKVRHSLLYIPLPFERQIQTSLRTWLCDSIFVQSHSVKWHVVK